MGTAAKSASRAVKPARVGLQLMKRMQVVRAVRVGDALGRAGRARCEAQTRG